MKTLQTAFIIASLLSAGAATARETMWLIPEEEQIRTWNRFVADVLILHKKRLAQHEITREESIGGYELYPKFYREVLYRDAKTGHLLAEIRWERAQAGRVHSADLYFRDASGRLVRDYSAMFLPWGRQAPIQTLVSFYDYQPNLSSFRKFDASGRTVYENCTGRFRGKPVEFDLDTIDMAREADGMMKSAAYRACFRRLPETAGKFLTPQ